MADQIGAFTVTYRKRDDGGYYVKTDEHHTIGVVLREPDPDKGVPGLWWCAYAFGEQLRNHQAEGCARTRKTAASLLIARKLRRGNESS
jgi:hypothetical protein